MSSRLNITVKVDEKSEFILELKPRDLAFLIEQSVMAALKRKGGTSCGFIDIIEERVNGKTVTKRVSIIHPEVYEIIKPLKPGLRDSFINKCIGDYIKSPDGVMTLDSFKARVNPDTIIHRKVSVLQSIMLTNEPPETPVSKSDFIKNLEGDFV